VVAAGLAAVIVIGVGGEDDASASLGSVAMYAFVLLLGVLQWGLAVHHGDPFDSRIQLPPWLDFGSWTFRKSAAIRGGRYRWLVLARGSVAVGLASGLLIASL